MRKILISFTAFLMTMSVFAGGLVTNTNQSALFTRLQNRNASTSVDAVYYNPAGLTNLGEGIFFSVNNQTINQKQTITSEFPTLTGKPREYIGKVSAPIFPSAYLALNVKNFSFSLGFNPIGGGGSAEFAEGLPSFEQPISTLPGQLTMAGIETENYSADIFFKGSSVYYGYQFNAGYRLNHVFSIAGGIRLVNGKNSYNGYLKNVQIDPNFTAFGSKFDGSMVSAPEFFNAGAATLTTGAAQLVVLSTNASQLATGLEPIVSGGGGGVLLSNGTVVGLTSQQITGIQQIMGVAGQTPTQINDATIQYAQQVLGLASPAFITRSESLTEQAEDMTETAAMTQDRLVAVEQEGLGYTPILSVNISAAEDLNISLRYEFKTKLRLKEYVMGDQDGGGMFVDGREIIADMPAQLAFGFDYNPVGTLRVAGTFNTYFDLSVDYDGREDLDVDMIDRNFYEYGLGLEYGFGPNFRASAGWVATNTGVNSLYQSDRRFSTNTNSFGAGVGYKINRNIDLNLGGQYTVYGQDTKDFDSFTKRTWLVGVGLDFLFGMK
jgi:long-chain fatty acid transport protein